VHWERYRTVDALGRTVVLYLALPAPAEGELRPLALFVPGSGCHSLFRTDAQGRIAGGYQALLCQAAAGRARVLAVEKPGVEYLDDPGSDGSALGCRPELHAEHTLDRWAEALRAAVAAARTLPGVDVGRLLAAGHSEGATAVAALAAREPAATHVASLAGSGPTQLFDLVEAARRPRQPDEAAEAAERRVEAVYATLAAIRANPDSAIDFAWGHPYRRWSSFLATSTLDELLRTHARLYLAHGDLDATVPIAAHDVLRAELARHGRDVTADRRPGADHGFRQPGDTGPEGMLAVFRTVLDWYGE